MNKYESVIIVSPSCDDDSVKKISDEISSIINNDGKVEKVNNLGKKKLAYEVKKNTEGIYIVFNFEANPKMISELERNYRINDEIIKFMTIKTEE